MNLQEIKDELKEMYPTVQGFIQHTLVAEMCLKWHEKQVKNCSIPAVSNAKRTFCNNCKSGLINYPEINRRTCSCGALGYNVTE